MRLPGPEALEKRGLVKEVLGTLWSPVCAVFPNSVGCTKSEPSPPPQPTPDPTPNPVVQTSQPVSEPSPIPTKPQDPVNTHLPQKPPVASPDPVIQPAPQPVPTSPTNQDPGSPPTVERPSPPSNGGVSGGGKGSDEDIPRKDSQGGPNVGVGTGTGTSGISNPNNNNHGSSGVGTDRTDASTNSPTIIEPGNTNSVSTSNNNHAVIPIPAAEKSGISVVGNGSGTSQKGVNPTATMEFLPVKTGPRSSAVALQDYPLQDFDDSPSSTGNRSMIAVPGNKHGGPGGIGVEDDNDHDNTSSDNNRTNSVPWFVGVIIAIIIFLLILLALLYRYRQTRQIQALRSKVKPFKLTPPYSKREKKRSSMGNGLLFSDIGDCRDWTLYEKRCRSDYGTLVSPVAHPSPTMPRSPRSDYGPLVLDLSFLDTPSSRAALLPDSPSCPSPVVAARRSSQSSFGGSSVASSEVMSPALISWPTPPSTASGPKPNMSAGRPKYTLMPRVTSGPGVMPSNWVKPPDWY
ncbi:hypothetical protein QBC38DRAFT_483522 [Podospora fimiseda]|uniref:Uncharacterized protein n=1 Tax=Podospora fimiseda TaxID=252190 RepID=A0AAN7BL09_9PEZI|nr:hypothetical protein QBC38DRAFT_483522 [Podospora fimiseda]